MADEFDNENLSGPYGGPSPLALLTAYEQYTTPEALEYARKILQRTVDSPPNLEDDDYLKSVQSNAEAVKSALRQARENLAAQEYGHQDFWLAAAQALGSPTETGAFGESLGNLAGSLREPLSRRRQFNQARDKGLLDLDLGMASVDKDVLDARLKLMELQRAHDTRMSVEALKQVGRRVDAQSKTTQAARQAVDREYAKDYVGFIQEGAADAVKALDELGMARDQLRGYYIDDKGNKRRVKGGKRDSLTGPIVGTIASIPWAGKIAQDIVFPDSTDVQETVEYTVQRSLRPILGAQFTKEEGERLIARVYNPRLEEEVNARRLDRLIQQLTRAYEAKVAAARYFEKHGTLGPNAQDPDGFQGQIQWSVDDIWTPEDDKIGVEGVEEEAEVPTGYLPSVEELPELDYESIIPAGEGYAKGGKVRSALKVIRGGLKTKPFDFEVYRSVSDDGGNFDATQSKKWSKEEILEYLADELEETGLDRSLATRFKVIQQPHFLEFDSTNPSHAVGYWQVRVDGPEDLVNQIDARWEAEDLANYGSDLVPDPRSGGMIHPDYLDELDIDPPEEFAEGGEVESERATHRMPDGRIIYAPPEVPYARILERYQIATGQDFGESPQAFDPGEEGEVVEDFEIDAPSMVDLGASALGHGILGALGGRYGTKLLHSTADLIPGHKTTGAEARVISALENEGLSPQEWAKLVQRGQKLGVPVLPSDMGGLQIRSLTEEALNPENAETRDFYRQLQARQDESRTRVEDQINKALKPDDYFKMQRKLQKDLKKNAKPLYTELSKKYPYLKSESLMQLMETPSGKTAVKKAVKAIRDRPGATLGKQDALGMITKPSIEFLDQVKDALDDMITKEEMKRGVYKATRRGRRLRDLRNALRDEVDTLTTDPKTGISAYKEARSQYAGDLEIMDALRLGKEEFMRVSPSELEESVKGMNFSERDALRTGVAQGLFDRIDKTSSKSNPAARIIDTPEMQKKLQLVFDKPNEYKILKEALDLEQQIFDESQGTLRRGKRASSTLKDPKDSRIRRAAKRSPTLGIFNPTLWAIKILRRDQPIQPKEAAQIIKMMRTSDVKGLQKMEKNLSRKYGRSSKRAKRTGKATALGAALGALAPLYEKYFGEEVEEGELIED